MATYGFQVIGAIVIFIVGRWIARLLSNLITKALTKADADKTLIKFAGNLCYIALLIFVIIVAVGILEVPIVQFSVVVGAAGLAICLALQDSLANFASVVLMLVFKPFKVGDFVEVAGAKGWSPKIKSGGNVIHVQLNYTVIANKAQLIRVFLCFLL